MPTINRKSQLPAHNLCIKFTPVIITDSPPKSPLIKLDSTTAVSIAIYQANLSLLTSTINYKREHEISRAIT